MRSLALGVLFSCASLSLSAATLTLSASGTYSGTTPTTAWTAPNAGWSLSFNVASNPVVNNSVSGQDFDAPVTNFVYRLNGNPVNVGAVDVAFFSTAFGGLIDVGFFGSVANTPSFPTNGLAFLGPQAYSGTEAAPTVLTGLFPETASLLQVAGASVAQTPGTVTISAALAPTPAPTSLSLILLGLAGTGLVLGLGRRRSRA